MARAGNHGIVIPRSVRLLRRLYWKENRSLQEIAAMFGVNHKSVEKVMRDLGIPRRGVGHSRVTKCKDCGAKAHKRKHPLNGSLYGTRCLKCNRAHYAKLAREYAKKPEVKAKRLADLRRWYLNGATNPTGEVQWINKGKILLRNARRQLLRPESLAACELRSAASALERSLRT